MSRHAVGALFAVFTAGTVLQLIQHAGDAFADPALRTWLVLIFWLLKLAIVSAFAYFVVVRPPARRPAREPVAFAACGAAILGAVALRPPEASGSTLLLLAGDAVAVVAAGWLLASVLALGRCFGFLPEARGLVTRGPYRLVRHPVYLGELGIAGGLLLGAPTTWNATAVAVLVAGQVVRMRLEERALAREFPEYGAYAARTPRLVPAAVPPRARGLRLDPRHFGAVCALALGIVALVVSHAALASGAGKGQPRASMARVKAPRQLAPAASARVESVPSFSWARTAGAAKYEFQLAADPNFESIVLGQGRGSFQTFNRFASVEGTLPDGTYYWRVRAVGRRDRAGRWSSVRPFVKGWTAAPELVGPTGGAEVTYPSRPLVLRWAPVPRAYKYRVQVATDPSLAQSALGDRSLGVETSGTVYALPGTLAPGRYYWAVTPLDAAKHSGTRSAVGSFTWSWPTATTARVDDLNADPRVFDPQFSWDPVAGAAQYQVEVNPSEDFAVGSRVCCDEAAAGTSLSPRRLLPNNTYHWRVRAVDTDGNAGQWNAGPSFRKGFDDVAPTIPNLRLRDNLADSVPAPGISGIPTTDSPIVAWDPVPGASGYEVQVAPWVGPSTTIGTCNWTTNDVSQRWDVTTATTAWTPLASSWNGAKPLGIAFPTVAFDGIRGLRNSPTNNADGSYCVAVRARADRDATGAEVVSDWTQLGGNGHPAFTYVPPTQPCTAGGYREPQSGSTTPRMPLFTWQRICGANSYFVVVARDREFTKVVDMALTTQPAYAPRSGFAPTTYPDETTSYYWAVIPASAANGDGAATRPTDNDPQAFQKRSVPPSRLAPADGSDVPTQPAFRWTGVEGAREYRVQVDDDPTFGSPIDDAVTNSTAYSSNSAYPADTLLYWRVRANDENRVGLTWSTTGSFRRRLPVPAPGDNPVGGEAIPVLSWAPVQGAVSYDMHVEQVDGTKRDFTMRSTAFTPVIFYGTGIWHWQVRANFKAGTRLVSGGYFSPQPYTRRIATPSGLKTVKSGASALVSWDPATMARQYRVQVSTSDSFTSPVEVATTENTSYAPRMTNPAFRSGQRLYWRVAVVDEGFNGGGWATSPLRNPSPLRMRVRGKLRRGRAGTVRLRLTDARRRRVAGARVTVRGPVGVVKPRRSGRRGTVRFRIRPTARGRVRFSAEKRGYTTAQGTLRVR